MTGKDGQALQTAVVPHGCAAPGEAFPDWARDFGRAAPLELEIGPGRGAFAVDHAAAHPEIDLVCIETRRSDCDLIRARAARRGLRNVIVLQGDAKLLVPRLFAPGSLSALHVQFPDPWWKKRHNKRRLVDVELAARMRLLLRAGGTVDFRTDVRGYAEAAVATWEEAGFVNASGAGRLSSEAPEVLSTRERRYAHTGQPVYRAVFVNPAPPEADARARPGRTGREWSDVRRK
jgi:tRNA (guanine-N7-)-methyltransferase